MFIALVFYFCIFLSSLVAPFKKYSNRTYKNNPSNEILIAVNAIIFGFKKVRNPSNVKDCCHEIKTNSFTATKKNSSQREITYNCIFLFIVETTL